MSGPLETRLDREEDRRSAAAAEQGSAAIRRRHIWRAEAAIGAVIRSALARAGVDAAQATRLCLADEAAAALVALSDTPELEHVGGDSPAAAKVHDRGGTDRITSIFLEMERGIDEAAPIVIARVSIAD